LLFFTGTIFLLYSHKSLTTRQDPSDETTADSGIDTPFVDAGSGGAFLSNKNKQQHTRQGNIEQQIIENHTTHPANFTSKQDLKDELDRAARNYNFAHAGGGHSDMHITVKADPKTTANVAYPGNIESLPSAIRTNKAHVQNRTRSAVAPHQQKVNNTTKGPNKTKQMPAESNILKRPNKQAIQDKDKKDKAKQRKKERDSQHATKKNRTPVAAGQLRLAPPRIVIYAATLDVRNNPADGRNSTKSTPTDNKTDTVTTIMTLPEKGRLIPFANHTANMAPWWLKLEPVPDECVPMAEWQTQSFPTCNVVHELDFVRGVAVSANTKPWNRRTSKVRPPPLPLSMQILAKGGMRLAWTATQSPFSIQDFGKGKDVLEEDPTYDEDDTFILKTLKWQRNYTQTVYEANRIDALVSERLSPSPHVIDIYGYCGNAVLNEMASPHKGSLEHMIRNKIDIPGYTWRQVLRYVTEAAQAIADIQSIDSILYSLKDDSSTTTNNANSTIIIINSTVVHNDMGPSNFLIAKNGQVKLSDFNLSVLQYWNTTSGANKQCGFRHAHQCGVHGAVRFHTVLYCMRAL
jgi:hypothetical protein